MPKKTVHERIQEGEFAGEPAYVLKTALEVEFGMRGHEKSERLWQLAWDRGHSGGLMDVYWEWRELLELVR